jgi:DNA polymerase-3 subunit gamma/tau
LSVADTMATRSLSFDSALQELGTLFHRIALLQFAPEAIADGAERARLLPYANAFDPEFLQLCYQIVTHGRGDLALAPDEYAGFSMTLLRLAVFKPEQPGGLLAGKSEAASGGHPRVSRVSASFSLSADSNVAPQGGSANTPPSASATPSFATSEPVYVPVKSEQETCPSETLSPTIGHDGRANIDVSEDVSREWHELLTRLSLGGMVRELAKHCELVSRDGSQIKLRLSRTHEHLLNNRGAQDKLQSELQSHLGSSLRLNIDVGDLMSETPAQRMATEQRERFSHAVAALENDPFVRDVIKLFDATLNESSIKPL